MSSCVLAYSGGLDTSVILGWLKDGVTDYSDLPTLLITDGLKLTLFREEELNLETAFMALTKGITA